MTKKILHAIVLVSMVSLILGFLLVSGHSFVNYSRFVSSQLDNELELAVQGVEFGGTGYLEALDAGLDESEDYRFTLISNDGQVLYDNETSLAYTENHKDRPEIKQAMETGEGMDTRYSSTLLAVSIYRAKRLSDGSILRISESRQSVVKVVLVMMLPFGLGLAVSWLIALVCARRMTLKIVDPINSLDLEKPLDNDVYPEITPLLKRIYFQRQEIDEQLLTLQRRADEFDQISRSMSEGLMVLDVDGNIVSINDAAMDMFDLERSCIGRSFLEVYRAHDFSAAVRKSLESGHEELRLGRNGRVIRFSMSRMVSSGTVIGLVILAFDITERAEAEDMRREFSANVSHELKTPLQGIIGSAELIEMGMAQGDDVKRFASNIRKEASRMVNLIEDIIGLSQLDEGVSSAKESVDLALVAQSVVDELSASADEKSVSLEIRAASAFDCKVLGVPRLIHEMLYNLVDNGIKYNVEGGKVFVSLSNGHDGNAVVDVSDTGIGIPKEHLPRIFERFYRVDKSHSRASGGTGLGLSIVKHVVMYHEGRISVESKVGQGTRFTVVLPHL